MSELNKLLCNVGVKNTGICDCTLDIKKVVGSIKVPRNKVFNEEELADLQATLTALTMAAPASRVYPFGNFVAVTDSSEDPTLETLGYGNPVVTRDGRYTWAFQFTKGGLLLSNAMRYFNGSESRYSELFYDDKNVIFGTKKKDADGNDGMAGIPQNLAYTYPWKLNDGSKTAAYRVMYSFDAVYINELIAYKQVDPADFIFAELTGLLDVKLTLVSNTGGVLVVKAETDCGENLADLFSTELAQVVAWKLYGTVSGSLITITSVTCDTTAGTFTLNYGTDDANLPANPLKISATLATPAVLAASPISVSGYESNVLSVASPVLQLADVGEPVVSGLGSTTATLTWADVPNAISYVVERSLSANFAAIAATTTVTDPTVTLAVTGLVTATNYYWRIKAVATGYLTSAYQYASARTA